MVLVFRHLLFVTLFTALSAFAAYAQDNAVSTDDLWKKQNLETLEYYKRQEFDKALVSAQETLETAEKIYGLAHARTATSLYNVGSILAKKKQHSKALPYLLQALEIRLKVLGPDHKSTSTAYNKLGLTYKILKKPSKAQDHFLKALAIRQIAYGRQHAKTEVVLLNLALLAKSTKNYGASADYFREIVTIREATYGVEHLKTATRLVSLGLVLRRLGDYQGAEDVYLRALAIRQKQLGQNNKATAEVFANLAFLKKSEKSFEAAEIYYRTALEILEQINGPNSLKLVNILQGYSDLNRRTDNHLAALRQLRRVLAIQELGLTPQNIKARKTRQKVIALLIETKDFPEAEKLQNQGLQLDETEFGKDSVRLGDRLEALGNVQALQGAWLRQAQTLTRLLAIHIIQHGPESSAVSYTLNDLAIAYENGGEFGAAEAPYRQALAIDEAIIGVDHFDTLVALGNLALLLSKAEKYQEAAEMFQRILRISRDKLGPNHPDVIPNILNLAYTNTALEHFSLAEDNFRQALALLESQPEIDLATYTSVITDLSTVLRAQQNLSEVVIVLQKQYGLTIDAFGENHLETAKSMNELAQVLMETGEYLAAEAMFRNALRVFETELGPEHIDVARSLNNLAEAMAVQGNLKKASNLFVRAISIGEKHPESNALATFRNNLAGVMQRQGSYKDAVVIYRQVLDYYQRIGPEYDLQKAKILNNLSAALQNSGDFKDAEELLFQAFSIYEAHGPVNPQDKFNTQSNLAYLFKSQGQFSKAETLERQVLKGRVAYLGAGHPDVAASLNNLGSTLISQGEYNESQEMLFRALNINIDTYGRNHAITANSYNSLGALQKALGHYEKAAEFYRQALSIREKALGKNHPDTSGSVGNLASVYAAKGDFLSAEPLYRRAQAISEIAFGPEHPETALALSNLALFLFNAGDHIRAEPLYRRAIAINATVFGGMHEEMATSLNNLAGLLEAKGEISEAEKTFRRALNINVSLFGSNHRRVASVENNLAGLLSDNGNMQEAEMLYRSALKTRRENLGQLHEDTATSLNNLALLLFRSGKTAQAEGFYNEALIATTDALGPTHPRVAVNLTNLGLLKLAEGETLSAARLLERAHAIYIAPENRTRLKQNGKTITISAAVTLAAQQSNSAARSFETVQWAIQGGAGAALADTALRLAAGEPELAEMVRLQQDQKADYSRLSNLIVDAYGRGSAETAITLRGEAEGLIGQIADTEAKLKRRFPQLSALSSREPLDAALTAELLNPGEALVLVVPGFRSLAGDTKGSIYVVRWDGKITAQNLESGNGLQQDFARLRCGFVGNDPACQDGAGNATGTRGAEALGDDGPAKVFDLALAYDLYRRIFAGVESALDGVDHLIVVPGDDALAVLPFQLLLSQPPKAELPAKEALQQANWLIRDHAITTLPTVSSLRALRKLAINTPPAKKAFLGIGDPVIGQRDAIECGDTTPQTIVASADITTTGPLFRSGGVAGGDQQKIAIADPAEVHKLARLPETRCELQEVASHLGGGTLLLDKDASESRIKSLSADGSLSDYRVISFATHGLIAGEIGTTEPALVLTPPKVGSVLDDGLLTASEVAALKLNAEFVILSACNTAAGQGGENESLSGLARAFFYAGAKTLLVSHWPVNSQAAVRLTTDMFANLEEAPNAGRAKALQSSMLAIIDAPDSQIWQLEPRYWAPFSLVGEGGG